MAESPVTFRLLRTDGGCQARLGRLTTLRGEIQTPAFMPVATQASVKGLDIPAVVRTGAQMILGNTYHLALRPGEEVVRELGGLHAFMGWQGPILTDSGGFQLFSLARLTKITEEGARFRSHIDGAVVDLSPERAVAIQEALGSDIAMVLDHVVGLPSDPATIADAVARTVRWAWRSQQAHRQGDQAQFAIVQGGLDAELRNRCARQLAEMDFPGYAIGGLSVGEDPREMRRVLEETVSSLPVEKPRYLMGVGRPEDLLDAIHEGVDLFDCVMPTRNGRNALAFTDAGPIRLRNLVHRSDPRPMEKGCPCPCCRHSRGYLRHLFTSGEMLGPVLLSIHNLTYYQRLLSASRQAIAEDRFPAFRAAKLRGWSSP